MANSTVYPRPFPSSLDGVEGSAWNFTNYVVRRGWGPPLRERGAPPGAGNKRKQRVREKSTPRPLRAAPDAPDAPASISAKLATADPARRSRLGRRPSVGDGRFRIGLGEGRTMYSEIPESSSRDR